MANKKDYDLVSIDTEKLTDLGFIESGRKKYIETVSEYGRELAERSAKVAEANRAKGMPIEIADEHVRQTTFKMFAYFREKQPRGHLMGVVGEYLAAAGIGIGGGNLPELWAVTTLCLSAVVGGVLLSWRTGRERK